MSERVSGSVRGRVSGARSPLGRSLGALLALATLAVACQTETAPESEADCQASRACQSHGRCTYDRRFHKCVVGSSADCARSNLCQKENKCRLVGEVCGP